MRKKVTVLLLDYFEYGVVMSSLWDKRFKQLNENRSTVLIDSIIEKSARAGMKRERGQHNAK